MLQDLTNKELIIIGGPNGAGKTTLAMEWLKENKYEYLSADDIAYELNPENPLAVRLKAGKEFFRHLNRFANDDRNLLIESTLSGKSLLNIIAKFQKEYGYTISIVFIFLDNEAICIERIQTRVKRVVILYQNMMLFEDLAVVFSIFGMNTDCSATDGCYITTPRIVFRK